MSRRGSGAGCGSQWLLQLTQPAVFLDGQVSPTQSMVVADGASHNAPFGLNRNTRFSTRYTADMWWIYRLPSVIVRREATAVLRRSAVVWLAFSFLDLAGNSV